MLDFAKDKSFVSLEKDGKRHGRDGPDHAADG